MAGLTELVRSLPQSGSILKLKLTIDSTGSRTGRPNLLLPETLVLPAGAMHPDNQEARVDELLGSLVPRWTYDAVAGRYHLWRRAPLRHWPRQIGVSHAGHHARTPDINILNHTTAAG